MFNIQICPPRGIARLFEEGGIAGEFCDADWDLEALAGEDCVCEGDVLGAQGAGEGDEEDAGAEGGGCGWVCGIGCGACGGGVFG